MLRLQLYKKLEKHRGCVNTVSFNADGDILISGSDDQRLILWNWVTGKANHVFDSGHSDNVFQAKFMPYTGDRSIVTCAADGQVNLVYIFVCIIFCINCIAIILEWIMKVSLLSG